MSCLTEAEKARRTLTTGELVWRREKLAVEIGALGGNPEEPWKSIGTTGTTLSDAAEELCDIDRILQRRRNESAARARMEHPSWRGSWKYQIGSLALEMVDAHAEHCGNARGSLREAAYGEPHRHPRSVRETSDAWSNRYDQLRYICEAVKPDNQDPVVVAFRRVLEDRKEPTYGWRNKAEPGEPPEPVDPAEKARADARMARYFAVWKELVDVVEETARCGCVGTENYCDHVGRCREGIAGPPGSTHYCGDCHLNAVVEEGG